MADTVYVSIAADYHLHLIRQDRDFNGKWTRKERAPSSSANTTFPLRRKDDLCTC
jgi:hypothetical protein